MQLKILPIKECSNKIEFLPIDQNGRKVNIYKLNNVKAIGDNLFYPNVKLLSVDDRRLYNPSEERVMSLEVNQAEYFSYEERNKPRVETNPVFYFVYNTDNYYHFIYDTLPYLISYNFLKKSIPNLKLLVNYPNPAAGNFYKFNYEVFELLGIGVKDFEYIDEDHLYSEVYVSSTYTYGNNPNLPPRTEVYQLFNKIREKALSLSKIRSIDKIYVSRRTWINNDDSNIGTNYTTRRKLANEDELVALLASQGYEEIFTENLSIIDKIALFHNAKKIVGAIGGGLVNCVFCGKDTEVISLCSPTFLDVNSRFIHSFPFKRTTLFTDCWHTEVGKWKRYMRIKCKNPPIIGEIKEIFYDSLLVSYHTEQVAGWNNSLKHETIEINKQYCEPLDNGLNSEWYTDLRILKFII